jgi:hypothetical protein
MENNRGQRLARKLAIVKQNRTSEHGGETGVEDVMTW